MESPELKKILETLLFITETPLSIKKLSAITDEKEEIIKDHIISLCNDYEKENRTLQIRQAAGGWQMATRPEYGQWVRKLYSSKMTLRLTQAAMETLCIAAYKQPITKSEIEAVRGVDSGGTIETLLQRKLIAASGRKEVPGRPILYSTTQEFLRQFGLNSLKDLPKLNSFKLENMTEQAQMTAAEIAEKEFQPAGITGTENSSPEGKEKNGELPARNEQFELFGEKSGEIPQNENSKEQESPNMPGE